MRAIRLLPVVLAACGSPQGGPSATSAPVQIPRASTSADRPSPPPADATGPFAPARLMADVEWLCDPERAGRGSRQTGGHATEAWLAARFAEMGYEVVLQPVGDSAHNVVAIRRAGPEAVLVSAHYDHLGRKDGVVHPGADDNASGVAVLLAMARRARDQSFEHTVIFVSFAAEEEGLVGSGHYVREPLWPLERTRAVINFDMVGRNFFEAGVARPAAVGVVGLEQDEAVRQAAQASAAEAGLALVSAKAAVIELFGYDDRTDEWWFRRRGILAVHFSTGLHEDYHQPSDTADKLVPAQMVRVARTASGLLSHLARAHADSEAGHTEGRDETLTTRRTPGGSSGARRR